jgi:hypothetical protein
MATFTRVNGYYPNYTTGTLRATSDMKAFLITLRESGGAIDLQSQDGDYDPATGTSVEPDQLVEKVIKELNPLMYHIPTGSTGAVHVIMHGHNVDADAIKARLVGITYNSGANTVHSSTTVSVGTAITVS